MYSSPYPYCSTEVVKFVIEMPDGDVSGRGYKSRSTAISLCDPATDHRMDTSSAYDLVRLPTIKKSPQSQNRPRDSEADSKRPPKEGSTLLPKFPAVSVNCNELSKRTFFYNDVPALREQLRDKCSNSSKKKHDDDYTRTRADIFRMELDRFDQLKPKSRPLMRKCYFAYLQNTEGSKRAIYDCLKTDEQK